MIDLILATYISGYTNCHKELGLEEVSTIKVLESARDFLIRRNKFSQLEIDNALAEFIEHCRTLNKPKLLQNGNRI